jgi:hypothetical protein
MKRTNSTIGRTELSILVPGKMFLLFVVELTIFYTSFLLIRVRKTVILSAGRSKTESSNSAKRKRTSDGLTFQTKPDDSMGRKIGDINNSYGRKDGKPQKIPTGHLKGKLYAEPWPSWGAGGGGGGGRVGGWEGCIKT